MRKQFKYLGFNDMGKTTVSNKEQCTIQNVSVRDFYASQAMVAVMGETQEMRIATFWDWVKHLLIIYLNFTFLTVKYETVDNVYEDAAKRCFDYAEAMINERNAR